MILGNLSFKGRFSQTAKWHEVNGATWTTTRFERMEESTRRTAKKKGSKTMATESS